VRFSHLLDRALTMGADYLATGHYPSKRLRIRALAREGRQQRPIVRFTRTWSTRACQGDVSGW
jgi:tRNA U34 2-thiouridine synthase MnmA/TrmU